MTKHSIFIFKKSFWNVPNSEKKLIPIHYLVWQHALHERRFYSSLSYRLALIFSYVFSFLVNFSILYTYTFRFFKSLHIKKKIVPTKRSSFNCLSVITYKYMYEKLPFIYTVPCNFKLTNIFNIKAISTIQFYKHLASNVYL